jgi:hypothetical protein
MDVQFLLPAGQAKVTSPLKGRADGGRYGLAHEVSLVLTRSDSI